MSIEFKCNHCKNVLKVADEHAGKSARCPSCKEVTSIPNESDGLHSQHMPQPVPQPVDGGSNPFSDPSLKSKPVADANPYRSPSATNMQSSPLKGSGLIPTVTNFDSIFSQAWNCWKENLGLMIGMTAIAIAYSVFAYFVSNGIQVAIAGMNVDGIFFIAIVFAISMISNIISTFLQLGQIKICLKLARQQPAEISDMFSCADKLIPAFVAGIIFGLMFTFGLLLLIVPGVLIALLCWSYAYLIVDNRAGIFDSLTLGFQIGKINLGPSFMMFIVSILLALASVITCGVGFLFTLGLMTMMFTVGYLKMTAQI